MALGLIIDELSIRIAGIEELKTVDVWAVLMIFFTILNPDHSYPFQNELKNIPNKVTSNMAAAFKQELQKEDYLSFSLKYLRIQAMFYQSLRSSFYKYLQYDPEVRVNIDSIKHFLDNYSMITNIPLFLS